MKADTEALFRSLIKVLSSGLIPVTSRMISPERMALFNSSPPEMFAVAAAATDKHGYPPIPS